MDDIIQENNKNIKLFRNVIVRSCHLGNDVTIGDDSFLTDSVIGNHCTIERRGMIFNTIIGDYSYTGYNTVCKFAKIGKFTSVSWNCSLGGVDHEMKHITMHPFPFKKKYGFVEKDDNYTGFSEELIIGNDVWIGSNVCVLRDITIADGSVIGAGAVVTHNVGAYEIWAGVPAKKIGMRFSENIIQKLIKLKWWDLPVEAVRENIDLFKGNVTEEIIDKMLLLKTKSGGIIENA